MKILSYQNMQTVHTLRLWTVGEIQTSQASDDPDYYKEHKSDKPFLSVEEQELTERIATSTEEYKRGFTTRYNKLLQAFGGDEEKLKDFLLETFKLENQATQ